MSEFYVVTARRWERGWELHIADASGAEVGVTQSRTLSGAEGVARDYLAADDRGADARIVLRPELGEKTDAKIAAVREKARAAERAQAEAAAESRDVVVGLKASGLSGSDIAKVLNVSTQRVSQLANSRPK